MNRRRENGESSPAHRLVEEIRLLRKGSGISLKKFENSQALFGALNRHARAEAHDQALELSLSDAYERFLDQVRRLGRTAEAAALRNALGIDQPDLGTDAENPRNLTQRRLVFSSRHGGWHSDTLENRENIAIDELVRRLLAYGRPADVNPRSAPSLVTESYEYLYSEYLYVVGPGGAVEEILVTREILSNTDALRSCSAMHSYPSDPRPGVVKIERYANCEIEDVEYPGRMIDPGQMLARIRLPRLGVGDRHRFMYRLTIDSQEPMMPMIATSLMASAQKCLVYRLQFHPDRIPDAVWSFETIDLREAPGEPDGANRLRVNEFGYVEKSFQDLERGLAYGLAWRFADKTGPNDAEGVGG